MKILNVRFGDTQQLRVKEAAEALNIDTSKLARAALRLGVDQLLALAARDPEKALDVALINEIKARQ